MASAPTPTATPTGPKCFWNPTSWTRLGLVYDFTDLKDRVKTWVDDNWDHAFLVNSRDGELINGLGSAELVRLYKFQDENPSCEVMSRKLYEITSELCGINPAKVRLWESANQFAEYHGQG